jgi:Dolichol kinase
MIEFWRGYGILLLYLALCASSALVYRKFGNPPREVFRKILHLILLFSLIFWIYAFPNWQSSVLAIAVFVAMVFPILSILQKIKGYSEMLTERKRGEIRNSLVVVFFMFAAVIAVCWGLLGDKILVFACIYAWGFGDAAAALVGKRYGKHIITGKLVEGRKSIEGTIAMFSVSFAVVVTILLIRGGLQWYGYIPAAILTAAACAAVELYTRGGYDTITCPFAASAVILTLVRVFAV